MEEDIYNVASASTCPPRPSRNSPGTSVLGVELVIWVTLQAVESKMTLAMFVGGGRVGTVCVCVVGGGGVELQRPQVRLWNVAVCKASLG